MKNLNKEDYKICKFHLEYVCLPLAVRFSLKEFDVTSLVFDFKKKLNKIS